MSFRTHEDRADDGEALRRRQAAAVLTLAGLAAGDARANHGRAGELTQLALATAEAGLRGYIRFRGGKQPSWPEQVLHAYLRWAAVQGVPLRAEVRDATAVQAWLSAQPIMREVRPQGNTTRGALSAALHGPSGPPNTSKGAACVPRAAACAALSPVLGFDGPRGLASVAIDTAAVTHGHPIAHAATAGFVVLLHHIGQGHELIGATQRTIGLLTDSDPITDAGACATVAQHLQAALDRSLGGGAYTHAKQFGWAGHVAEEALAIGVWAAAHDDLATALARAGDHGGERHATQAIAGAIWGALAAQRYSQRGDHDPLEAVAQPLEEIPDALLPPAGQSAVIERVADDLVRLCRPGSVITGLDERRWPGS
ncbi:ADP-ribosylglycohydrolase [Solirubrobacter pauli]|uniref:ADP-ribosylglycohydrolase n=1 Tax=Solirubrobacter pauli TaxID=166793 RepID=A0A660LA79_9ACTN|nr:ADP-ribosylglycohydrolase family protein [Solirubrobacter pauli]RKQ90870.1 ADP-ribosylglycohydrolase [Solirubrobacter pauli]